MALWDKAGGRSWAPQPNRYTPLLPMPTGHPEASSQTVKCSRERTTALLMLPSVPLAQNQDHRLGDGTVLKNHFYSNFFASELRKLRPRVRKVLP